ncbi:hypothetical protein DFH09DRAFT_1029000 [Mycena vulgaris]|nr:hypothetical protein DFH09DRAFT_1029000 [Mycena vulgaris]
MSGPHRNRSTKHALPPNLTFIDFPRSDGDPTYWPQNTTRKVDEKGNVNYMQPVGLDEPLSVKWRVGAGDAISEALKLTSGQPHVFRDFPSGYRLFDHNNGKADNPRHDVYLFGPPTLGKSRFRSVQEFIPHALWLMGDGSDQCKCKYCSRIKPHRKITSSIGNPPSPSRPSRLKPEKPEQKKNVSKPRVDRLKNAKVSAAVQKNNIVKGSPQIQTKNMMLVERENDLRDACQPPSEGGVPRWFREGELVWCALQTQIPGPQNTEADVIKFWPAIIDEVKLSIHAEAQADTPWIPHTVYKVQFLAISRAYIVPDSVVIPYQSHLVSGAILREMAERPVDDWDLSPEKLANFDPCPPPPAPVPAFGDTLTPLAVALQISSMLSTFWCLTDDWEAKLSVASAPARPIPSNSALQSATESAGTNNAYLGSMNSPDPSRGPIPSPPVRFLNQRRFQGIWWGGEHIWADDLVRLKVPRSCLAPGGAQQIFAPSGLGKRKKAAHEFDESRGDDPSKYGAIERGVFMKIETIFVVDEDAGAKRECRVSGMLYELADSDWEDPNLPRNVESTSIGPSTRPSAKFPGPASSGEILPFPLPPPPMGYKFRPILAPGHEAVMSLALINGRYYPFLLKHPLLQPYLSELIPSEDTMLTSSAHLWALDGLFGGYKNSVDPSKHKPSREKMISDATKEAMAALEDHIKERRRLTRMEID